ncbi:hypothetical protein [Streptomyces violaceoruber]|uniref:hypothetical protein n=1 Tax=Streptomyces violaceoruber TaxID=1935 RepID=UPI003B4303E5
MTGPEHYREAERLIAHAESIYLDSSDDPAPRGEYASEAAYVEALQTSNDLHREAMRTVAWTTSQAQVHATLALAAATAMNDAQEGLPVSEWNDWRATVGREEPRG